MGLTIADITVLIAKGDNEAVLSDAINTQRMSFTVARGDARTGIGSVPANSLYGRSTIAPGKLLPFAVHAPITAATNSTSATVTVSAANSYKFKVGDLLTYYDVSAGAFYTEKLTADIVNNSTGVVTFTGEVWATPPEATDLLVLESGNRDSAEAVFVEEAIDFTTLTTDVLVSAIVIGILKKASVNRRLDVSNTYGLFIAANNPYLKLIDPIIT